MSALLSPKPAAISGTMALKRTPMHRLSLPASGVLYHGLIRVVSDIRPSLDLLRFFLRSVFHFRSGSVDPLSFSVATAHRGRPARAGLLLPSLLARRLIVQLLIKSFSFHVVCGAHGKLSCKPVLALWGLSFTCSCLLFFLKTGHGRS